eukprot:25342-Rhodomonas_salina.1
MSGTYIGISSQPPYAPPMLCSVLTYCDWPITLPPAYAVFGTEGAYGATRSRVLRARLGGATLSPATPKPESQFRILIPNPKTRKLIPKPETQSRNPSAIFLSAGGAGATAPGRATTGPESYQMCGTGIGYRSTRSTIPRTHIASRTARCAVQSGRLGCYAMSGTEAGYAATRRPLSTTETPYA